MVALMSESRIDESLDNLHHICLGFTGSGKTTFIKRHPYYRDCDRVLAWDPEGSYSGLRKYTTKQGFLRAVKAAGFGKIRARLELDPTPQNFDWFCSIAWAIGYAKKPMTVIAEELADVVKAGYSGKHWGFLSRKGRKYGIRIMGVSQRPQIVDKTFLNQCRFIWCGLLRTPADQKYMAGIMALPTEKIATLEECHFYIRNGSKPSQAGKLTFKQKKK